MRIKKFVAATARQATDQMKQDLGADAIILNTRKVNRGGVLSFLGREMVELTAAVDEVLGQSGSGSPPVPLSDVLANYKRNSPVAVHRAPARPDTAVEGLRKVAETFEARMKDTRPEKPQAVHALAWGEVEHLKGEVEDLKVLLGEVATQLKYNRMPTLPEHLKNAYITLVEHDVDEELAAEMVQAIYGRLTEDQLAAKDEVEKHLLNDIADVVKTDVISGQSIRNGKIIALVGPTGVGKTTTVAKLAAIAKLMKHKDVALISADTYRIGAIQQLRSFAAIANIPMEVVYEPADMETALLRFKQKDIIFLDTVGRSQRSEGELVDLARFVGAAMPDEVHLVLSASADQRSIRDVIQRFRSMSPNRLIFSKVDEAVTYGGILNVCKRFALPISYVTTGQNVPDDIRLANPAHLASLVYTGVLPNA